MKKLISLISFVLSLSPSLAAENLSIKTDCYYIAGDTFTTTLNVNIKGVIEPDAATKIIELYKALTAPKRPVVKGKNPLIVGDPAEIDALINNKSIPRPGICANVPQRTFVNVELDTPGGDVDASLAIGKFLLSLGHLGKAVVNTNSKCLSSCVFILAGAQDRYVNKAAKVGIHRPYLRNAIQTDPAQMKVMYDKLTEQLRDFFEKAGIDTKLADQMMRIPPEKVLILSRDQLNSYGLAESNVAIQETMAMREALDLKISREELAKRKAYADRICRYDDCESIRTKAGMTEACMRYTMCVINAKKNPVPDR